MEKLGLKQFRSDGCLSYIIYDPVSMRAAIIDPTLSLLSDYREFIVSQRLLLNWALDTHTHADHLSGTHELAAEFGAEIGMSEHTESERPGLRLKDAQKISLGSFELEVKSTPGHTPDSACYYLEGTLIFTGDTLFIGSTGRTDFPGSDSGQQWDSLQKILGSVPGTTVVLPGHDYSNFLFSTVEIEKRKNPQLLVGNRQSFVDFKKAEVLNTRKDDISATVRFNLEKSPVNPASLISAAAACGAPMPDGGRIASINVEKYAHKLEENRAGVRFIDVREPEEYLEGHIPRTENIPLSELSLRFGELRQAHRIYVSCLSGRRSQMAARTLNYLGLEDVVNVSSGFQAWAQSDYPIIRG